MDAAIDRLTKLYVEKDEALLASSSYRCSTHPILLGLLTAVGLGSWAEAQMREELPIPFYYSFHGVTSTLRMTAPKYGEIASALRRAGFRTSQSHCDPLALKTDAPGEVVFDVFRAYFQQFQREGKEAWLEALPDGFAKQWLTAPAKGSYDFAVLEELKKEYAFARFPGNPEPNWGPKARGSLKRSNVEKSEVWRVCWKGRRTNRGERLDYNRRRLLEEKTHEEGESEEDGLVAAMLHVDVNQEDLAREAAHEHPVEARPVPQRQHHERQQVVEEICA